MQLTGSIHAKNQAPHHPHQNNLAPKRLTHHNTTSHTTTRPKPGPTPHHPHSNGLHQNNLAPTTTRPPPKATTYKLKIAMLEYWITSHIEDVSPEEMEIRSKQQEYIEAMEYAQNSFNPFLTINKK
jgi:hypothetical protein